MNPSFFLSKMLNWLMIFLIVSSNILLLNGCSMITPPLEFAPDGNIINKAIVWQIKQTQINLSKGLNNTVPQIEVEQIKVKKIEPIFIQKLAAYHLYGDYKLILTYPQEEITQNHNQFDIYLQRQPEGKSWRLLKKIGLNYAWKSYLIP